MEHVLVELPLEGRRRVAHALEESYSCRIFNKLQASLRNSRLYECEHLIKLPIRLVK